MTFSQGQSVTSTSMTNKDYPATVNQPISKVDLVNDSITHLLAVSFAKTSSKNYPLAVNVAQGAAKYDELTIGRILVHLAAFQKNKEDAARALALLGYISGWKTVQIFAGGKIIQNYYRATEVLNCYLEALACTDYRAHCFSIINDPYSEYPNAYGTSVTMTISLEPEPQPEPVFVDRYIFPCQLLQPYFRFQTDHPASPEDQIQASAVERGCDFCPLFDAHSFGKTGTKAKAQR